MNSFMPYVKYEETNNEYVFVYKAPDNQKYFIELSDDGEKITVFKDEGLNTEIGSIELTLEEEEQCGHYRTLGYKIIDLSLEKCKRLGIGTQCLLAHKERFNEPLAAESIYNICEMNDGSHLIGDGPAFITAMRNKGIVCADPADREFNDDDY